MDQCEERDRLLDSHGHSLDNHSCFLDDMVLH